MAGALAAAAGLPEAFAGGTENATKAYSNLQAAGRASIDAEAARLKAEVDTRQQRLLAAGLDATAGDAVELKRLEQLQSILELQGKIRTADPSLVTALAQRSGDDLSWYRTPPPAPPAEPQVIQVVLTDGSATHPTPDSKPGGPPPPL